MKLLTRFAFATLLMVLVFSSCATGPIETIVSESPDGKRKVTITGKVQAPMDPIMVGVTISTPGGEKSFEFSHQANSLTKENVSVVWEEDTFGTITLKFDDEGQQIIDFKAADDQVVAVKRFGFEDLAPGMH